jgi:8-amino-7-oxononanoate synthase
MEKQSFLEQLRLRLLDRERRGLKRALRELRLDSFRDSAYDFASNDYLGFARSSVLAEQIEAYSKKVREELNVKNGSSGSRLLTGDSALAQGLEAELAQYHDVESCLLFNAGYDCNLGLFSCIAAPERDALLIDERVHASIHDGCRLSRARMVRQFRHNDLQSIESQMGVLRDELGETGWIIVGVESCYSMDGDLLVEPAMILERCLAYRALLIVDEAHAIGIHGPDGCGFMHEFRNHPALLARVVTFGKALGQHGAAVLGSSTLCEYLLNYARPVIYSTSLPVHSLCAIRVTYQFLRSSAAKHLRHQLLERIAFFHCQIQRLMKRFSQMPPIRLNPASPIQAVVIPGNEACTQVATGLRHRGFDVYPIRYPTVERGSERLRIVIHAHNTNAAIEALVEALADEIELSRAAARHIDGSAISMQTFSNGLVRRAQL